MDADSGFRVGTWGWLLRGWKVTLVSIAAGVAVAWANGFIHPALGRSIPFAPFYPLLALAGYLGGALPVICVGVIALVSVSLWHADLAGAGHTVAFDFLRGVFAFIALHFAVLSEVLLRQRRAAAAGSQALRALPEAEARFAAIAQTSPDALWIYDMNRQRVTFISRAAQKLTGIPPEDYTASSTEALLEQVHPEDRDILSEGLRTLAGVKDGQTVEYEVRQRHRNGTWRWMRNRVGVFTRNPGGSVAQVFGHSEDVTDRRDATERLEQQAVELARVAEEREVTLREREALLEAERAARSEAERANRLKDDFLATVSHELRTPLTAMLGWTSLLSEQAPDEEFQQGLEVISRNARAQRQLIEDLLDMSRIMSGKLRIEPSPVLLPQVIASALETVKPAADARGVTVRSALRGLNEPIDADAGRLQQIIWNLLSNAVKFTPAGGTVSVSAAALENEVTISIADTGQGIAPEFVPHVFERFRQEDGATTRKAGGLGLGLAIVKHLVELHGGTISAHSDGIGKGATFRVSLPVRRRSQSHFGRSAERPASSDRVSLDGFRLLVIDDEADTRSYLQRLLTERGAAVSAVSSAAEGLAQAVEERPDAIICDISMPGEDGYSFIRRLRAEGDGILSKTPAAALTALARAEDRERALAAGFDEHCTKPVDPGEMVALLLRLLSPIP